MDNLISWIGVVSIWAFVALVLVIFLGRVVFLIRRIRRLRQQRAIEQVERVVFNMPDKLEQHDMPPDFDIRVEALRDRLRKLSAAAETPAHTDAVKRLASYIGNFEL